ncbi:MAG: universal stress protein [Gammaproteobacteria bacterium]
MMSKILACIDDSAYIDHICHTSAWASQRTQLPISLLHVLTPHSEVDATINLSGAIGLGAKSDLLEELTEIDEERGKLEQRKGHLILEQAKERLAIKGIAQIIILHRRGDLVETVAELVSEDDIIIMGKGGTTHHFGAHLEPLAQTIHTPLMIVTREIQPIHCFLIAYDGSISSQKIIDYAINNPLLKGLACHLLQVNESRNQSETSLKQAEQKLKLAGFCVQASAKQGKSVNVIITDYIAENSIDLLVMGAYGHSKIRRFILGSTTTALMSNSNVPLLILR